MLRAMRMEDLNLTLAKTGRVADVGSAVWRWWLRCSNGVTGGCLPPSSPPGGAGLLIGGCWLGRSRRLCATASLGAPNVICGRLAALMLAKGTISDGVGCVHALRDRPTDADAHSDIAACRRLRAILHALAAHAARSRRQHAAAAALAARREESLLRILLAGWSDLAATRRRLRATSDLVRLFYALPWAARSQPASQPARRLSQEVVTRVDLSADLHAHMKAMHSIFVPHI